MFERTDSQNTMRLSTLLAAILPVVALSAAAGAQSSCGSASSGSCLQVHPGPGCNDQPCCQTVCGLVPDCCDVGWDDLCVDLANSECDELCGSSAAGDCRVPHANPSCNDADCCAAVCLIDPGCCQFQWDLICTFYAEFNCEPPPPVQCGSSNSGSCLIPHGTPACNNTECCETVCDLDPTCCNQSWDVICVQLANSYCFGCTLNCPGGSITEVESCGVRANDACVSGQTPQSITCGQTVCGTLDGVLNNGVWSGDRDAYAFTAVDSNGDGTVKVTIRLASEFQAFAALVPAVCPVAITSSLAHVEANGCLPDEATVCVPPGSYRVIVAPGTYPNPGLGSALECLSIPRYSIAVECAQTSCGDPCNVNSGSCFTAHNNPGCDTIACCQAVCAADPFCCSDAWDSTCVTRAGQTCGLPVPPNDHCTGALPIATDETIQFSTVAATISAPAVPAECEGGQGVLIGPDVWFVHTATCSGNLSITTCGSVTDMRLVVYEGTCEGLILHACNTDSPICVPQGGSRVQFTGVCGKTYLIRVGGDSPQHLGDGQITVACPGPSCEPDCLADIDGDGVVGGADLGALLAAWGTATHDLDNDGVVSGADLGIVLAAWGPCP
jgi:hypothetical protein